MYRLLLSCGPPTDKISLISHAVAALKCSLPTPTQWMDFKQIIPAESLHMINNYLSSPKQPPLAHFCLSPTSSLNKMFILTGELQPTSVFPLNSYPCHKFKNLRHSFCFCFSPSISFFFPTTCLDWCIQIGVKSKQYHKAYVSQCVLDFRGFFFLLFLGKVEIKSSARMSAHILCPFACTGLLVYLGNLRKHPDEPSNQVIQCINTIDLIFFSFLCLYIQTSQT